MTSTPNGVDNLDEDAENILEGTLALIKPDAVDRAKDIIKIIVSEGFLIVEKKRFQFTREARKLPRRPGHSAFALGSWAYHTFGPKLDLP